MKAVRLLLAAVLIERRLIAERTRDGIAAARAEGRKPDRPELDPQKLQSAITLIRSGLSPSLAAKQVGVGRSTLYRELSLISPDPRDIFQSPKMANTCS